MSKEMSNIRKELSAKKPVLLFTNGRSMEPLLYDRSKKHATHVLVEPCDEILQKGELPLVVLTDGRYMIHRIIGVHTDKNGTIYHTRGDNCLYGETVPASDVIGRVTKVYRKGRTIRVTDRGYRIYSMLWTALYPLRAIRMRTILLLSRIKTRLRGSGR